MSYEKRSDGSLAIKFSGDQPPTIEQFVGIFALQALGRESYERIFDSRLLPTVLATDGGGHRFMQVFGFIPLELEDVALLYGKPVPKERQHRNTYGMVGAFSPPILPLGSIDPWGARLVAESRGIPLVANV